MVLSTGFPRPRTDRLLLGDRHVTAIRELELTRPIKPIRVETGADRCMIVIRWRGRVVGRAAVSVLNREIGVGELKKIIRDSLDADALEPWIDEFIAYDTRSALGAATPAASVVICTRERPDDLARALHAVANLRPAPFEVVVIDNAPTTDATRQVVAQMPFARYVREDRPGLNAARNRALREARGPIVAFVDDDAAPDPQWLSGLLPNFADPSVAVTTGLTLPLQLETEGQELFEEHCSFVRGFVRRVFDGQIENPFAVGPVGAGANMAVRKDLVMALGGFDERLDGGTPTRSGGDHELFIRVLSTGYRIVYDPAAVSWHRHRRTKAELLDTAYGYGVGVYAMWTGLFVERREIGMLRLAWAWLRQAQLPNLLQRRDPFLRRIAWRELRGCVHGPMAWFASRRLQRPQAPA